ncbi:MAG: translation initiation factor IF-2 [Lachnospiraceae bacterium]|nr:translation initiation factor IF-2 [Lachnospiraceae bacterium]
MAKMKIHELAKEVEKQSKEVIAFLQEKGIEAKAAQSTIDEDAVALVRKHFGKNAEKAEVSEEKPAKQPQAAQAKEAAQTDKEAGADKTVQAEKAAETAKPAEEAKAAPKEEAPKKKKTIIVVSNPQNSRAPGQQNGRQQGNGQNRNGAGARPAQNGRPGQNTRPAQNVRPGQNAPIRPIKPLTPPSPTPSVQMVPPPRPQKARPEQAAAEKQQNQAAEKVREEAAVVEKPQVEKVQAEKVQETTAANHAENRQQGEHNRQQNGQNRNGQNGQNNQNRNGQNGQNRNGQNGQNRNGQNRGGQTGQGYNQTRTGGERPSYGNRENNRGDRPQGARPDRRTEGGGRQGSYNNQGGFRGGSAGAGGERSFGNSGRDSRGNGGQRDNFRKPGAGKGFIADAPIKDAEKHRDEEKRRISQEKDKRSRKDFIYEEEDAQVKNKPGRFIKPEKKKEEVVEEVIKVIVLPESITIKDLAEKMKIQSSTIIKKLFLEGKIVTLNQEISYEEAENIAMEYDILCEKEVKVDVIEELLKEEEEQEEEKAQRPPVICVMGHVDHGKTSLLDAIRKTNVTDKEAGGITQHIGAYTVSANGRKITFLDTPGHEAFTAMRMRGANATDIAILVVAADDGVMPQTVEAINHAKAAGIEIVVAVNKIDKPNANIDRVKQELTEYELIPVDWGGTTEFVPVSAKSGEGIEDLLETILLTADILELKANPNRRARGLVIEAELDKGRGPVATVLVQKGTLHVGDFISAGASHGKVRAMIDDKGRRVKEAGPSTPVEILGLSDVPSAGEVFLAHENDKTAKSFADTYLAQNKEKMLEETKSKMSLDDLFSQIQEGNLKELNLIVKADVQGSVEAVKQSLLKLSNEEVVVKCIHGGVGAINESDVMLASASSAIIIGFNVRPDTTAKTIAEREGVDVRLYRVIYQAIEDIEAAMKGMLDPIFEEKVIGHAEVRQIFKASAVGNIAGSYVLDGMFQRNCKVRISREGKQIFEGELASLKRFKDDVKEVKAGFECGLVFEGFDQMQELDIVEAYIMVEVPR